MRQFSCSTDGVQRSCRVTFGLGDGIQYALQRVGGIHQFRSELVEVRRSFIAVVAKKTPQVCIGFAKGLRRAGRRFND
jgi:hypothetical protein